MARSPSNSFPREWKWSATLVLAFGAVLVTGCAGLNYDRIQLGQEPREYERALPAESSRRTHLGLCNVSEGAFGRMDALVVLLTHDRRVAGKIQASRFVRNWGLATDEGFLLRGELDPQLAELQKTGPVDALRAIAGDLANYRGEKLAMQAYTLAAGGLVRLIQCWPHVNDVGVAAARLNELYERVPGGGEARLAVDRAGTYRFEYRQGKAR